MEIIVGSFFVFSVLLVIRTKQEDNIPKKIYLATGAIIVSTFTQMAFIATLLIDISDKL